MTTITDHLRIAPVGGHPFDLRIARLERNQRIARWIVIAAFAAVILIGCAKPGIEAWIEPHLSTGNSIAESKAFNSVADGVAETGQKKTKGEPNQLFTIVRDTLAKQLFSLDAAAKSHDQTTKAMLQRESELAKWKGDYAKLYQSFGARAERFVRKMLWIIAAYLFVAVALRIVGQLALGPFGGVAAIVSTIMLGPLAWIQAGFDNVFFRKLKR